MIKKSGQRKRFSAKERRRLIQACRRSGLTQKQFTEENGIRLGTFQQWLVRERKKSKAKDSSNPFQEVQLPVVFSSNSWAAELKLDARLSLRLSASAPVDWVCGLVKGLGQR